MPNALTHMHITNCKSTQLLQNTTGGVVKDVKIADFYSF